MQKSLRTKVIVAGLKVVFAVKKIIKAFYREGSHGPLSIVTIASVNASAKYGSASTKIILLTLEELN